MSSHQDPRSEQHRAEPLLSRSRALTDLVVNLRREQLEASAALLKAAETLQKDGVVPEEGLADRLRALRDRFSSAVDLALNLAIEVGLDHDTALASVESIPAVYGLSRKIDEFNEGRLRVRQGLEAAAAALGGLGRLARRDGLAMPMLDDCKRRAAEVGEKLLAVVRASAWDAADAALGEADPYLALWHVARHRESLPMEEALELAFKAERSVPAPLVHALTMGYLWIADRSPACEGECAADPRVGTASATAEAPEAPAVPEEPAPTAATAVDDLGAGVQAEGVHGNGAYGTPVAFPPGPQAVVPEAGGPAVADLSRTAEGAGAVGVAGATAPSAESPGQPEGDTDNAHGPTSSGAAGADRMAVDVAPPSTPADQGLDEGADVGEASTVGEGSGGLQSDDAFGAPSVAPSLDGNGVQDASGWLGSTIDRRNAPLVRAHPFDGAGPAEGGRRPHAPVSHEGNNGGTRGADLLSLPGHADREGNEGNDAQEARAGGLAGAGPGGPGLTSWMNVTPPSLPRHGWHAPAALLGAPVDPAAQTARLAAEASAQPQNNQVALNTLLWALVRDNRLGLASHMSRYMEYSAESVDIPSGLLESLVAGPLVRSSGGLAVDRVREALRELKLPTSESGAPRVDGDSLPIRLLVLAGGMRAELLGAGSAEVLHSLRFEPQLNMLAKLRDTAVAPGRNGAVIPLNLLGGETEDERWQQSIAALQERCAEWLSKNLQSKVIFHATTAVWHHWLKDNQPIGMLVGRVISNRESAAAQAREEAKWWASHQNIEKELRRADLHLRGVGAQRKPIGDRAVTAIRAKCGEAVALVTEWLDLLTGKPAAIMGWVVEHARQCRENLMTLIPQCSELAQARAAEPSVRLAEYAAWQALRRALADLHTLVAPASSPAGPTGLGADGDTGRQILLGLNADLLRVRGVPRNEWWGPVDPADPAVLSGILELLGGTHESWPQVLQRCWADEDFLTAGRVLDVMAAGVDSAGAAVPDAQEVTAFCEQHEQRLADARRALQRGREEVAKHINGARLKGIISENTRLELANQVESIDPPRALEVGVAKAVLLRVRQCLAESTRTQLAEFRQRLDQSGLAQTNPGAFEKLQQVLDSEDIFTANEYLAIIQDGGALPEPNQRAPGHDYFPQFVLNMHGVFFGDRRIREVRDLAFRLSDRRPVGSLDLENLLTPGEARQARDAFNAWSRLKSRFDRDEEQSLQTLFGFLGFEVQGVERLDLEEVESRHRWFEMTARPLQSRLDCAVPDFGSRCEGKYLVVCLTGSPLQEQLVLDTRADQRALPVIALFFEAMSDRRRRDLAHALMPHRARRLLVLDPTLLLYLCLQRQRLLAFFNAACHFTPAAPYIATSGQVAPEMFYGRSQEIAAVFNPDGTSLVYGGRQLGKTALLREVSRRYHNPELGTIVRFADLRHGELIGLTRPLDDIWAVVVAMLEPFHIVNRAAQRFETIRDSIIRWLDEERGRRIVLLLDEADVFLNSDSKEGWPRVGQLKTIMDSTARRFKVVFSGLHNVQRASHDPNTPMAHLGQPICVGPFLSREELGEATQMVSLPLQAMGYRFQSDELVGRILAQANFYPSLIQLICSQLLQQLVRSRRFGAGNTPPYEITLGDIDSAYADPELQNQIRERFRWTLELDNRYRVTALRLALEVLYDRQATAGFPLAQIRQWALDEWPEGFTDTRTIDAFRTLLEEMVELGVLREVSSGRYTLRSPNLVGLLGTEQDIYDRLQDASHASKDIDYDTKTFRRVYDQDCKWRRSPLTADQEAKLLVSDRHGVTVLFGTPAAGLTEVAPFLNVLSRGLESKGFRLETMGRHADAASFLARLVEMIDALAEGQMLVLVPATCDWSPIWVAEAGRALRKRAAAKKWVGKVLFLANSAQAWGWAQLAPKTLEELEQLEVQEMSLSPWAEPAIRRWKREAEFGADNEEDNRRLLEATGYWCHFLHELGRRCVDQPEKWLLLLDRFAADLEVDCTAALGQFGVLAPSMPVLSAMAQFHEPISAEELTYLLDPPQVAEQAAAEQVAAVLRWADRLQLIQPQGQGRWTLDPFLRRLLLCSGKQAGSSEEALATQGS